MKQLITHPDLLVISSYPEQYSIHGKQTVGIASYTKNTLLSLRKAAHRGERLRIRVLAEKLKYPENSYRDKDIDVRRVWTRNSLMTPFILLRNVIAAYETKRVMLQFELAMFGNPVTALSVPLLLLCLRLLGKEVTIVTHQVIDDFNGIAPHADMKKFSFRANIVSHAIHAIYASFNLFAYKVIVLDSSLKQQLSRFVSEDKITVIPHGVENSRKRLSTRHARSELGYKKDEFVLLCFGYEAWYKGTDWIVRTVSAMKKKLHGKTLRLVIAGGANPNHESKPYYKTYLKKIEQISQKSRIRIDITGFVPEERIGLYYSACDLVVLPYRYAMSASGPLSFALSYKKPFMISDALKSICDTPDMQQALRNATIDPSLFTFALTQTSFKNTLETIIKNPQLRKRLGNFAAKLGLERKFKYIGYTYYRELFIAPYTPNVVLSWKQHITSTIPE